MDYVNKICQIGQGNVCCTFLTAGTGGYSCAKLTSFRDYLQTRAKLKLMHAQGDNCKGQEPDIILDTLALPDKT